MSQTVLSEDAQTDLKLAKLNFYDLDLKELASRALAKQFENCFIYFLNHPTTKKTLIGCSESQYDYLMSIKKLINDAIEKCIILHDWTIYFAEYGVKKTKDNDKVFYNAIKSMNFLTAVDFLKIFHDNEKRINDLFDSLGLTISVRKFNEELEHIMIAKLLKI